MSKRQSHSREKTKRAELFQPDENKTSLFSPPVPISNVTAGTTYSQTFPDTAVLIKQTSARAKKQKADTDLGMAPLQGGTPFGGHDQTIVTRVSLPKVTCTVSKPPGITSLAWNSDNSTLMTTVAEDKPVRADVNFSLNDQYGNPPYSYKRWQ